MAAISAERPLEGLVADDFPEHSFPKHKIKILLLENIHKTAVEAFEADGFSVTHMTGALSEEELIEILPEYFVVGVRSKTHITANVIAACKNLMAIACFCIGTNQVDLEAARAAGIPVWNSPFCNSRSVAELMVAQIISLARCLGDRNKEMHAGTWAKTAKGCTEIRGKSLGIIGYGHIGSQLSVLAESMGMNVSFYDISPIMPLGNATSLTELDSLLSTSDFVTLHVPATPDTVGMIGAEQIALMKPKSYLLNASRGNVVDLSALADALNSGHLAGAYVDVYPEEPKKNTTELDFDWWQQLNNLPNTILTPHIGGSTIEAQVAIANEVSYNVMRFINEGRTTGAVNFPNLDVRPYPNCHRICNIHRNVPGHLKSLDSYGDIGYLVVDVDVSGSTELLEAIRGLPTEVRSRILY